MQGTMNFTSPNRGLTSQEMLKTLELFKSVLDSLHKKDESNTSNEIEEWLKSISKTIPLTIFRSDSIISINNSIFDSEIIRTFVFDLYFNFFSLFNENGKNINSLIYNIKNGLNISEDNGLCIIPKEVEDSLISSIFSNITSVERKFFFFKKKKKITLEEFLKANKQFLIVILICLVS